jgi:hypothetical protein|tara:strand:- start:419 stop:1156 length:738 start_codon:yes stop_codon:yes gene_type:complete
MTDSNQADQISICIAIYKSFNKNNSIKQRIEKEIKEYIPVMNMKLSDYKKKLKLFKVQLESNELLIDELNKDIERKKNSLSSEEYKKKNEIIENTKLKVKEDNSNIKILEIKISKQEDDYKKIKEKLAILEKLIVTDIKEYESNCSHIKELVNEEVKKQSNNRKNRTLKTREANETWNNLDLSFVSRSHKGKPESKKIKCNKDEDCIKPNSRRKYKCVKGFCKLSEMSARIDETRNTTRLYSTNS